MVKDTGPVEQSHEVLEHVRQLEYWTKELANSSPAEFLTDFPRPSTLSGQIAVVPLVVNECVYQCLRSWCRAHGVPVFAALFAAFRITHYRLTWAEDATIGTRPLNRNSANTQCLRVTVEDNDTFESLTHQVQSKALAAHQNQDIPFDDVASVLLETKDTSRHPLVQLRFAFHSQKKGNQEQFQSSEKDTSPQSDVIWRLLEHNGRLSGTAQFATDLFKQETICNMVDIFQKVLHRGLEQPHTPISTLPLIDADGLAKIHALGAVEMERTDYPRDSSLVDVFRKQAAAHPDTIAITESSTRDSSARLTYSQLDQQSDELASWLRPRYPVAETLIGVYAPRSCETIVALLGILKANLAYLPLDVNAPIARIKTILSTIKGPKVLLFGSKMDIPNIQLPDIVSARISDTLGQRDTDDLLTVRPSATSLAYVMFTSGSTGTPKGVMVEHRNVLRLVKSSKLLSDFPSQTTQVAHLTSIAFDVSIMEIFVALLNGSTLVCIDYLTVLDSNAFAAAVSQEQIRVVIFSGALLQQCIVNIPETVSAWDAVFVIGDRFNSRDAAAAKALVRSRVYNGYGPTENGIVSTVYSVREHELFVNGVPIGRTVTNSGVYVMDRNQQLVPVGVMGELVVTGEGLARGYTNPALDVDRFVFINIGDEHVRAYRTGDKVRIQPEGGQLEFFGRIDQQFKIRGHRIESAEIENSLLNLSALRDAAVVVTQKEEPEELEIIAFVVAEDNNSGDVQQKVNGHSGYPANQFTMQIGNDVRKRLQKLLPTYMIPARIIVLDQMPLNINGKIDRKELERRAKGENSLEDKPTSLHVAPRNDIEVILCEEYADVLGITEVGITGNFFDLGGHSLMATKLAARLSQRLSTRVSVREVFDKPIVGELAATIRKGSSPHKPIPRMNYAGPVEQSFAQGRMWFLDQLIRGSSRYLLPFAIRLRGQLQTEALTSALNALEQRHQALRTTFETQDGVGMQVIQDYCSKELRVIDASAERNSNLSQLLRKEQTAPFDLTSEPGWRVSLLRVHDEDYILCIVMHHIISDDWSNAILRQELSRFYSAALRGQNPLSQATQLPIQYWEFAVWQKQDAQKAEHQRQLEYWTKKLTDSTPAELLSDHQRPAVPSGHAGEVQFVIEGSVFDNLHEFCRNRQISMFTVLLTAFRATHYRLAGVQDANIGTPVANRDRLELEEIIGFFVNTQCLRIQVNEEDTFEGLILQVRSTVAEALANHDVPFERLVAALSPGSRDMSRNPLVQLMFALHSQPDLDTIQLEGLKAEPVPSAVSTRFDAEFHLSQGDKGLKGSVLFAADLFERETIRNMVAVFQETLRRGIEEPHTPVSSLALTDGIADLRSLGLFEIERTEYPKESSIVDIFGEQVVACPDAIVVVDSTSQLTYSQLDKKSNKLAAWLRRRRLPAETPIGVFATRSCQGIVAFLGILKANLTYLPLDIKTPIARIETILSAAITGNKLVLLSSGVIIPNLQLPDVETVWISDTLGHCDADELARDTEKPSSMSLAYIMFTSGSTGKPKGVMVEHRSIIRLVKGSTVASDLPQAPRVAHLNNIAFDVSVWEILVALLNKGTLICIDYLTVLDGEALANVFARQQVRVAFFPTALLKQYLADKPSALAHLELLHVGGERLDGRDAVEVRSLIPSVYNAYGPTESHVCTMYKLRNNEDYTNGVPIGRAVSNTGVYIMDSQQRLVSKGVMGELIITGDALARGYKDSALDLNRFVEVQLKSDSPPVRAYRTGDLVRYRPKDCMIEAFGRMDQQIKIRGHRIELAEVEHTLLNRATVRDAAVVIREDENQTMEIVAFVLIRVDFANKGLSNGDTIKQSPFGKDVAKEPGNHNGKIEKDIRNQLKAHLPSYMIPAMIIILDQMPLNPNGKVDRTRLTQMAESVPKTTAVTRAAKPEVIKGAPKTQIVAEHVPVLSDVEAALCEEFGNVLGVEVNATDNFFDLGGHSLLTIKLATRISRRLNLRVSIKDIFDEPVPIELANKIERMQLQSHPLQNGQKRLHMFRPSAQS